jgi:mannose-6-phosphate isomerase
MESIRRLRNPIREYSWGSHTALAELLGEPSPSPRPQAELWMGAHPSAPSEVRDGAGWITLGDWIRRDAVDVLGAGVVGEYGEELPFLLKLIAAERPLSLQAHPNSEQARSGFERENRAGIPIAAPHRSYLDPNPKPELICALTPFAAMCGFRPLDEIVAQVDELRARGLAALLGRLRFEREPEHLRAFFEALMGLDEAEAADLAAEAVEAAESGYGDPEARGWLRKLAAAYPGDRGVVAPLFLNLVELRPGDALFLPAGQLHSYLYGTAVEIMANSDNVLRGGLTEKHVDAPELLATLEFEPRLPELLAPLGGDAVESSYATPAREFALSVVEPGPDRPFDSGPRDRVEILFCSNGAVGIEGDVAPEAASLTAGAAAIVPAVAGAYRLSGQGAVYRATVPRA